MSYQVLYRTYRPQRFDEVVGQDYIVKTLKNAIKLKKIAHAYLFSGPRGTGKTTIAKLFAKAINCENFNEESCDKCASCLAFKDNHPDIIELDAASNNSIDDIREIIEQVPYAPIVGKYKVYIIDEVHMLTSQAFNALLKTLEEPPSHVVFILATTDPQKIIPTVLSRCQRYNFSKISNFNMVKKMKEILENEKIKYDDAALDEIAVLAEGGMRDALSILEQVLSYNSEGVFIDDIRKIFGLSTSEEKVDLLINAHHNITQAISSLREMYNAGIDAKRLAIDLLEIIKEALIYSDDGDKSLLNKLNIEEAIKIKDNIDISDLLNDITYIEESLTKTRGNQNFLTYLELALVKMSSGSNETKVIVKKEEVKKVTKDTIKEEPTSIKEEIIEEPKVENIKEEISEEITPEINETEDTSVDLNYLASLLLSATKEAKINDEIIYNRLDVYRFEADKRKFYEILKDTSLFASGSDFIVIVGDTLKVNSINSKLMKEELYNFINEEFGIDKVIIGLDKNNLEEVKQLYKELRNQKEYIKPEVVKPHVEKQLTNEEKALELFPNLKVNE